LEMGTDRMTTIISNVVICIAVNFTSLFMKMSLNYAMVLGLLSFI